MKIYRDEIIKLADSNLFFRHILDCDWDEEFIELPSYEKEFETIIRPNRLPEISLYFDTEEIINIYNTLIYFDNRTLLEEFREKIIDIVFMKRKIRIILKLWKSLKYLWKMPNLPIDFLENNISVINWEILCRNSTVPESFFESHITLVNWRSLSFHKNLSEGFFRRNLEKCNNPEIWKNPGITETIAYEFFGSIDWLYIGLNPSISESFFRKHINNCIPYFMYENPSLSEEFFKERIGDICWYSLCKNPSISEKFFNENLDKICWETISTNPSPSEYFFIRHHSKVNKSCYSNRQISLETIIDHWVYDSEYIKAVLHNPRINSRELQILRKKFGLWTFSQFIIKDYNLLIKYKDFVLNNDFENIYKELVSKKNLKKLKLESLLEQIKCILPHMSISQSLGGEDGWMK